MLSFSGDSVLTFLLKENLGGNSKTAMVAAVSPSADNYEESYSTLMYADRAKQIVNKAFVNEDATAKIVRQLREELEALRAQAGEAQLQEGMVEAEVADKLREQIEESGRLLRDANMSWEEKLQNTEFQLMERATAAEQALEAQAQENATLKEQIAAERAQLEAATLAEQQRLENERRQREALEVDLKLKEEAAAIERQTWESKAAALAAELQRKVGVEHELRARSEAAQKERMARQSKEAQLETMAASKAELESQLAVMEAAKARLAAEREAALGAAQSEATKLKELQAELMAQQELAAAEAARATAAKAAEKIAEERRAEAERRRVEEDQARENEEMEFLRSDQLARERETRELREQLDAIQAAKREAEGAAAAAANAATLAAAEADARKQAAEVEHTKAAEQVARANAAAAAAREQQRKMDEENSLLKKKMKLMEAAMAADAESNAADVAAALAAKDAELEKVRHAVEEARLAGLAEVEAVRNEAAKVVTEATIERERMSKESAQMAAKLAADATAAAEVARVTEIEKIKADAEAEKQLAEKRVAEAAKKAETSERQRIQELAELRAEMESKAAEQKALLIQQQNIAAAGREHIGASTSSAIDEQRTAMEEQVHSAATKSKELEELKAKLSYDQSIATAIKNDAEGTMREINLVRKEAAEEKAKLTQIRIDAEIAVAEVDRRRQESEELAKVAAAREEKLKKAIDTMSEERAAEDAARTREKEKLSIELAAAHAAREKADAAAAALKLAAAAKDEQIEAARREAAEARIEVGKRAEVAEQQHVKASADLAPQSTFNGDDLADSTKKVSSNRPARPTKEKSMKMKKDTKKAKQLGLDVSSLPGKIGAYLAQRHYPVRPTDVVAPQSSPSQELKEALAKLAAYITQDRKRRAADVGHLSETLIIQEEYRFEHSKMTDEFGSLCNKLEKKYGKQSTHGSVGYVEVIGGHEEVNVLIKAECLGLQPRCADFLERISEHVTKTEEAAVKLKPPKHDELARCGEHLDGQDRAHVSTSCDRYTSADDSLHAAMYEVAIEAEEMKETMQKTVDKLATIIRDRLGIHDNAHRNEVLRGAEAIVKEKRERHREAIFKMSRAKFGEHTFDGHVSLIKFVVESTQLDKVKVMQHMKSIGNHNAQGVIFMPKPDKNDGISKKWERFLLTVNLMDRTACFTKGEPPKVKKIHSYNLADLKFIHYCNVNELRAVGEREDGIRVSFVLCLYGWSSKPLHLCLPSEPELKVWTKVFEALLPKDSNPFLHN